MNACSLSGLPRVISARPARNSSVPDAERPRLALGVAHDPVIAAICAELFVGSVSAAAPGNFKNVERVPSARVGP